MTEGGVSRFSVEKYSSDSAENFRGWRESFRVSFISGIDKVWIRGESSIKIFRPNFFVSQCRKNSYGNPLEFHKFRVWKKFFASEGYVKIFDFLSQFFCLTVPKKFVGEPFCAVFHKIFGSEQFMHRIGVEYQDFPSKTFCLTVPRNFVRKLFNVSLLSDMEKFFASEGHVTFFDFLSIFLSHSAEKFRR